MTTIVPWLNQRALGARALVLGSRKTTARLLLSLLAAGGAAVSGAAPTGYPVYDGALLALSAALVVGAAFAVDRRLVLPMVAVGMLSLSPLLIVCLLACLPLLFNDRLASRIGVQVAGAVAAAVAVQALLRLEPLWFFGLPSLLAAVAVSPLVIAATTQLRGEKPRGQRTWIVPTGMIIIIYLVALGVAGQGIRQDTELGIEALEAAADAAVAGDSGAMVTELERSHRAFRRADNRLNSTTAQIGRLIPGVGQQIRASDTVMNQAVVLSGTARQAGPLIYPDVIYAENGWIAFDLLDRTRRGLAALDDVVSQSEQTIEDAPRAWLLPQLETAMDSASAQLETASDQLSQVEQGFATIPQIFGAESEQRILVLLTTPAETRERGGFVGAYALLSAKRDGLEIVASGPQSDLRREAVQFSDPSQFSNWFLRYDHVRYPHNLTSAPSLQVTYDAVQQLFPTLHGKPVDTVAYIDPAGMSAFVEAIGSIRLPRSGRVIAADDALDFLLREQYLYWSDPDEQSRRLSELFEDVFLRFLDTGLPSPSQFDTIFGDQVRGGNIALVTSDPSTNRFLTDMSLQRQFPGEYSSDFVSVVQTNAAPSKLDAYLRRHIDYHVFVDPSSGVVQGSVTVDLASDAPPDLPDYVVSGGIREGERPTGHDVLLSIYTPHLVTSASIDGRSTELVRFEEYGLNRAMARVRVDLGAHTQVTYKFFGELPTDDYQLRIVRQPLAFDDQMTVDIVGVGGWILEPVETEIAELPSFEPEFDESDSEDGDEGQDPNDRFSQATNVTQTRMSDRDDGERPLQFRLLEDLTLYYQPQAVDL